MNADVKSGINSVKVPIWSTSNQSDIKWYDAVKQEDGTYLVHMNIANHKYNGGTYHTHVYVYGNDGSLIAQPFGDTILPALPAPKDSLTAEIKNVNEKAGSYDVVVYATTRSRVHHIMVPIWSAANQNDIRWYEAKKQSDGIYVVHMNISNHKYNRGVYHTHVYMYRNDRTGKAIALSDTNVRGFESKLSANITNVDISKGTYDVLINGEMDSGVREILVPIWSDKNQKDIKWYRAEKQIDGSYVVHMSIVNHNYNRGIFNTHVYMYGNNGSLKAEPLSTTNLPDVNNYLSAKITNVDQLNGKYDVVVTAHSESGIRDILVPIWSDKKQKDIKWYKAEKQSNGTYIAHMDISNHNYNRGVYNTHVYMYYNNGGLKAEALDTTNLPSIQPKLTAEIKNIDINRGTYDVVVNGQINSGIREILVPVWSDKNQKDIKWYKAEKQSDGSYIAHINISNHNHNRGIYNTHVYMYSNKGDYIGMVLNKTNLPDHMRLSANIINVNNALGTYDVVIDGDIETGIKEILVPIWSKENQSDIFWYKAERQNSGKYIAHMNFRNHHFSEGIYNTHVYMYSNSGRQVGIVLPKLNLTATSVPMNQKRVIFIDPGHGGYDPGAVGNGLREKDITLSVARKVRDRLVAKGYPVIMRRDADTFSELVSGIATSANNSNADIFVSIHVNSGGSGRARGIETYWYGYHPAYPSTINKQYHNDPTRLANSSRLANAIHRRIISATNAYDRGVFRETYAVLRETRLPAVLIETGFIDNASEASKLGSSWYQDKLAQGIVEGIEDYYA